MRSSASELVKGESTSSPSPATGMVLILGFCSRGPYRHAEGNLLNPKVKWLSWGYHEEYVHPAVRDDLKNKRIHPGTEVVFSLWSTNLENRAHFLRKGKIDYITFRGGYVVFTVFLDEFVSALVPLPRVDHYLCRYIDVASAQPEGPTWMVESKE